MKYEVVETGGVVIGVGVPKRDGPITTYTMICNTLFEGDKAGKQSRQHAQRIAKALNETEGKR